MLVTVQIRNLRRATALLDPDLRRRWIGLCVLSVRAAFLEAVGAFGVFWLIGIVAQPWKRNRSSYRRTAGPQAWLRRQFHLAIGCAIAVALIIVITLQGGNHVTAIPLLGLYGYAGFRLLAALARIAAKLQRLRFGSAAVNQVYAAVNQVYNEYVQLSKEPALSSSDVCVVALCAGDPVQRRDMYLSGGQPAGAEQDLTQDSVRVFDRHCWAERRREEHIDRHSVGFVAARLRPCSRRWYQYRDIGSSVAK